MGSTEVNRVFRATCFGPTRRRKLWPRSLCGDNRLCGSTTIGNRTDLALTLLFCKFTCQSRVPRCSCACHSDDIRDAGGSCRRGRDGYRQPAAPASRTSGRSDPRPRRCPMAGHQLGTTSLPPLGVARKNGRPGSIGPRSVPLRRPRARRSAEESQTAGPARLWVLHRRSWPHRKRA